jgi:hypothetical protein
MKRPLASTPFRLLVSLVAVAAVAACSVSTAHLTDLKVGKDKDISTPVSTFAPTDTIYASSGVANTPSKVTLQWHLIAEKVTGQSPNFEIPQVAKSFDLDSDGTSTYDLSPPSAGWPTGTYEIKVDMLVDGQQKDEKTAEFTVAAAQ